MKKEHKDLQKKEVKSVMVLNSIREFAREEDAVGVVEIILILVVLIGLVIIFKSQLTSLVSSLLSKVTDQSNSI